MDFQKRATEHGRHGRDAYRGTARAVGALFLAGMVVGIGGNGIVQSIVGAPNHLATVSASSGPLATEVASLMQTA